MMNSEEIIHLATSSYNMKENPLEMDDDSYITMEYTEGSPKAKQMNSILELGKSLLQAAREGDTVKVIELMSKGAPFTTDWLGTSPLHLAAMNNHMDTCETLLGAGIGKDAKTKVDRTPLHFAAYEGHADIVKLLINYNVEVDCKDMLHMTPLHWAVERQHEECAILLIQGGADVTAVSRFHKTPMSIAQEMDWESMLEMLHYANLQRCGESISNTAQAVEGISEDGNNITEDIVIEQETSEQMDGDVHIVDQESETQEHIMENILPKVTGSNNEATVQMLREHGIVMLPQDTSNTITSAVQSGRKVVLSDAGKLLLKDIKSSPKDFGLKRKPVVLPITKGKNTKIFTMSSSQFALALAEQNKQNSSPTKPLNNTEILDNSKYKTLADKFRKLPVLKAINLNKTPPKLLSKDGKLINPYKGKIISLNSLTKLPSNLSEELMNVQGKAKIIQLKNASNLGKTVKIVVKNNNNTLNNKIATVKMENTDKPSTAIQTSTVSTLNIATLSGVKTFPAKVAPQKDQGDAETLRRELMETKNELEEYKKKFEVLMNELNILKSNQILIKVPDPNHVEHNQTLSGFQLSESVVEESELITPVMDSG